MDVPSVFQGVFPTAEGLLKVLEIVSPSQTATLVIQRKGMGRERFDCISLCEYFSSCHAQHRIYMVAYLVHSMETSDSRCATKVIT